MSISSITFELPRMNGLMGKIKKDFKYPHLDTHRVYDTPEGVVKIYLKTSDHRDEEVILLKGFHVGLDQRILGVNSCSKGTAHICKSKMQATFSPDFSPSITRAKIEAFVSRFNLEFSPGLTYLDPVSSGSYMGYIDKNGSIIPFKTLSI